MKSNNNYMFKPLFFFFSAFLFLMPLIGGLSKVNNLLHISLIIGLFLLVRKPEVRKAVFSSAKFNAGLVITSVLLIYYSCSSLWGLEPVTFHSDLTHSIYILFFIIIFSFLSQKDSKNCLLYVTLGSTFILSLLTFFYVDKHTILTNRLNHAFALAPENVIDMAGYYAIGIFCGLILLRETGKQWLYLPIAVLFVAILLTQSRGPLFSLIFSLIPLVLLLKRISRNEWLIILAVIAAVASVVMLTSMGDMLISRITRSYSQSFIRFGIWENALSYVQQKPWFGWGFGKEIDFINEIGQRVHTTHSLYIAALLKGGVVGLLLLMSVIGYGFYMGWQQIKARQALEASMFLFATLFYFTQGMFVIGNPGTSWVLFWLPLAVVMSLPKRQS